MFDIKKYTYEIWCISRANDVDVGVGRDMFMANVRAGENLYDGAKGKVDYKNLKSQYDASNEEDILAAFKDYNDFKSINYQEICKLFVKQDIAGLKKLCGESIVTPQITRQEISEEKDED